MCVVGEGGVEECLNQFYRYQFMFVQIEKLVFLYVEIVKYRF